MNYDTLQPLLGIDKSNPFFEVLFNPDTPEELLVHFGMRLLETVPRNSFQSKLLIARLFNAGYNLSELSRTFAYDRKTIRNWGGLLKSGKTEDILKIEEGQGAVKKITDDRLQCIMYLFHKHHKNMGCHITAFIVNEYSRIYSDKISNESVRKILLNKRQRSPGSHNHQVSINEETNILFNEKPEIEYLPVLYSTEKETAENLYNLFFNICTIQTSILTCSGDNSWKNDIPTASKAADNSKYSPWRSISCDDNFPMVKSGGHKILSCHHIGILLSRIFIDFISENLGIISNIVRQWTAMILSGCQNIEQGQGLDYRAFELFIGRQKTSANKQRDELKSIADCENVNLLFKQNIKMINAQNDDTFLLDPHGVPYTGQLRVLKCWLGGSHSIGKGYYLDLIHTLKGEPVFSIIDDNYYDLRQRFLADIRKFRKILSGDKNRVLTIIVDRAIYDVEFMKMVRKYDIHIITWEKNYKKGQWNINSRYPVKTFYIMKYRNRKEDTYTYTVQYYKKSWEKEKSFAQYTVLLSKPKQEPIELSILCTDFLRDPERAIKPILIRWLQENDMGYLIALGINQITSYSYSTYESIAETVEDRNIKNKEFIKLTAEKLKFKKVLGLQLVNRELYLEKKEQNLITLYDEKQTYERQITTDNINSNTKITIEKRLKKINVKIKRLPKDREKVLNNNLIRQDELRKKIKELDKQFNDIPREISRIEIMIRDEYVKLNFMPKTFMDAVKITARNIIYQLLEIFRPIWNNYRNDLVILRELILSMGHIEENEKTIVIQLNPARQFSKKQKNKILLFLFEISNRINQKYNMNKVIAISLYEL